MKNYELINKMTLEEKASLLSGKDFWLSKTIPRLNIESISFADGPHGIRKQAAEADHLGLNPGLPATSFPTSATIANSWNESLASEVGELIGKEAVAYQVSVLLGPGLNIKRSPLCGRNFEYFSEDPYLSGKLAASYIRGVQTNGISACPKHFAANNQELLRMSSNSVVDDRALHEIYLTGFEIAVKEGKPKSIMTSYNKINDIYANEHTYLLQDILVDNWGFDGLVVTDWGGSNDHVEGVRAGSHMEMPATKGNSDIELINAVLNGSLSMEILDKRVDEYLEVIKKLKSMEQMKGNSFDKELHHDKARKAAEESIVLLKNNDHILPLKDKMKVAIIGDFALTPRYQGAGSSIVTPTKLDSTVECIKDSNLNMLGYSKGFERFGEQKGTLKNEAIILAKDADVVLLYLGLDESAESEGMDRTHISIRENQISLLKELKNLGSKIIVVLCGGAVIEMPWIDYCDGLIYVALPGQAGAGAIVNILTGKVCPSGKLSESYPMEHKDTPAYNYYPGRESSAEYRESLFVGYRYYDTKEVAVRFPFGFGLSYTIFEYSNIVVTNSQVKFTITNTGLFDGAEISQLYFGKQNSEVCRPKKELKGFAKTFIKAGESCEVIINFDDKSFRYYNIKTKKYEIEGGEYQILIGVSSNDIKLNSNIIIDGTNAPTPYDKSKLPSYNCGNIEKVSDDEFEILLGRKIPATNWDRNSPLGRNDTISQMSYAKSFIARFALSVVEKIIKNSDKKGNPNLNLLFIYNMPFRAIAKMSDGILDINMVDDLLEIVNGHIFKGLFYLIKSHFKSSKLKKQLKHKLENNS